MEVGVLAGVGGWVLEVGQGKAWRDRDRDPNCIKPPRDPTSNTQPPDSAASGAGDAALFDLVQQRLVADAKDLRRLAAIPVHLPQRLFDRGALGLHRCRLGHRGQRSVARLGAAAVVAAALLVVAI